MGALILIIDDDLDDIGIFKEGLNEVDADAECVGIIDGEKALHFLKNNERKPDYIFLDLNLPRLNGKRILQQIRQDEKLKRIPVIIYTTSTWISQKEELVKLGADYFITKPSSHADLLEYISFVLHKKWKKANMH